MNNKLKILKSDLLYENYRKLPDSQITALKEHLKEKIEKNRDNLRHHSKNSKDYSQDIKTFINAEILAFICNKDGIQKKIGAIPKLDNTFKKRAVRSLHHLHDFKCFFMCITLELFAGLAIDIAVNSKAFKFDEIVELYQNRTWRGWLVLASLVLIIILMTALPALLSHKVFSKYERQRESLFLSENFAEYKNCNIEDTLTIYGQLITGDNKFTIEDSNSMLAQIKRIKADDLDPFEAYNTINDLLWEKGKCQSIIENDTSINNSEDKEDTSSSLVKKNKTQAIIISNDILDNLTVKNEKTNCVLNFLGFGKKTLAMQQAE